MRTAEELREALISLQQENEILRKDASQARLLLRSLESLLQIGIESDPFVSVFESLRNVFAFDQVLVLAETGNDALTCIVADPIALAGCKWPIGRFFAKVMGGRVSATFSNDALEEWREVPSDFLSPAQPALYLPINVSDRRGILVLLRAAGNEGFDRSDVALGREFSLLASHALAGVNARQMIENNRARAIAAEDANRSKNLFIANMSHELRTPLNAVIGFSELIATQALGPVGNMRYVEYIRDIHASGNHLLGIVNNLLLFSKMEAGQHRTHLEILPLHKETAYVERLLQFDADRCRVTLVCDPIDDSVHVLADQQSLRQILINVIGNAIKFSPEGGEVRLRFDRDRNGSGHRLRVTDRGCGIPSETLEQLGNPFVQAEDAYSRKYQGTGLGLAICFGLADAMKSRLDVESVIDRGTTVTLTLPATVPARSTSRLSAVS